MSYITTAVNCNGCGTCNLVCPMEAISFLPDDEGFLRPLIDKEKCINCGVCVKRCSANNIEKEEKEKESQSAYAAHIKDKNIRMSSSSGGIFTAIATIVIENGGVVFGAAFDDDLTVKHIAIRNTAELKLLQGSKYVQSQIGDTYLIAKQYLNKGIQVLFTGTPCQIQGLYSFLNKEYDNLITQDVICHGVPSPMIWKKYIEYREKEAASTTQRTFFRHKKYGWKMYSVQFQFQNCTEYIQIFSKDLYMRSFLENLTLRPSCYQCSFKGINKQSDITLADFWGIDKTYPQLDDNMGVSLVILNSKKGHEIFKKLGSRVISNKVNLDEALRYNSAYYKSPNLNPNRENFIKCVAKSDFKTASKKYLSVSLTIKFKKIIKKH